MAAVLCDQQAIQQAILSVTHRNPNPDSLRQFATWVQEQLRPEHISWFFTGQLVLTHARRGGWQYQYKALPGRQEFRLDLTSGGTLVGHAEYKPQTTTQNWESLFATWRNSLTEQERMDLDKGLVNRRYTRDAFSDA